MKIKILIAFFLCIASASLLSAQETALGLELLTVNDQVTTVITATEPIRFVDISTGKVAGDQPLANTLRLKPKEGADVNADGDVLAVVTVITERYRVQYGLIYTTRMNEAVTEKTRCPCPRRRWPASPEGFGTPLPGTGTSVQGSIT